MSWQDIPGWSDDIAGPTGFYEFIQSRIPQGGVFVEAGVFMGRSLAYMGERRPDIDVWAVDPWDAALGKGENWNTLGTNVSYEDERDKRGPFGLFMWLMQSHAPSVRYAAIQAKYVDARHPPADLVFIDGLHDIRCYHDIAHAATMLKPGGIIAGHDYVATWADGRLVTEWPKNPAYPGVVQAVQQWAGENGKTVRTDSHPSASWSSCWWIEP
jgi:methyltransferase family protein